MNKETVQNEYSEYSIYYKQLQKEIFDFLNKLKDVGYKNIDIAEVKTRPGNGIKSLESINNNIDRKDKYTKHHNLLDIKDIAGVRVVCHCEDDLAAFSEIVENKLNEARFLDVKREDKPELGQNSSNPKSRPSYRAVHITLAKKYKHKGDSIRIYCEVQLRTVMADAWAVQDRLYLYGDDRPEGDRHVLTDAVSEIMKGCESLWALVKKKCRDGQAVDSKEFEAIKSFAIEKPSPSEQEDIRKFDLDLKKDNL